MHCSFQCSLMGSSSIHQTVRNFGGGGWGRGSFGWRPEGITFNIKLTFPGFSIVSNSSFNKQDKATNFKGTFLLFAGSPGIRNLLCLSVTLRR